MILFSEASYLFSALIGLESFKLKTAINRLIPSKWFVIIYVTLYFISPLLNIVITKLVEKGIIRKIIVMLVLAFSVYPIAVDLLQEIVGREFTGLSSIGMYGSQWGYSIVNFALMYIIGAYLRNSQKEIKVSSTVVKVLSCTIVLVIWAYINDLVGFGTERSAWEYCNPVVILLAVELFKLFSAIQIETSKWINEFAKGAFTVYLLHGYFLPYIQIEKFVQSNSVVMLIHVLLSAIIIYGVCFIVYKFYELVRKPICSRLMAKIPLLTANIYEGL